MPVTFAGYELSKSEGFYDKNPGADVPIKQLARGHVTANSQGFRLGRMPEIRNIVYEETEKALQGQQTAQAALDSVGGAGEPGAAGLRAGEQGVRRAGEHAWSGGRSFPGVVLPLLLVAPQLLLTAVFFLWPAGQAIWSSTQRQDAFGLRSEFVGFENFSDLFADPLYLESIWRTAVFCAAVSALAMGVALVLAVFADREIRGRGVYRTLLIGPYAIAPAVAAVLWILRAASADRAGGAVAEPAWGGVGLQAAGRAGVRGGGAGERLEAGELRLHLLSWPGCRRSRGAWWRRRGWMGRGGGGGSGRSRCRCWCRRRSSCWW